MEMGAEEIKLLLYPYMQLSVISALNPLYRGTFTSISLTMRFSALYLHSLSVGIQPWHGYFLFIVLLRTVTAGRARIYLYIIL